MTEQPKDGGPAFPFAATDPSNVAMQASGMSLRDWFAGKALAGLTSNCDKTGLSSWYAVLLADHAYEIADAMIAARGAK